MWLCVRPSVVMLAITIQFNNHAYDHGCTQRKQLGFWQTRSLRLPDRGLRQPCSVIYIYIYIYFSLYIYIYTYMYIRYVYTSLSLYIYIYVYLFEPDPHTAHQPQVFHRGPLMPGMHGPLGFTTGGCPAATPARPQQPPPKGAPWLPTAGHGRVDSTPTLAAGHFILHHQVDFSSCTPGRQLRLGLVTQQGPSRAGSAGRSAVLGGKPQQGEFKAIPRLYIYIYIYIYIHTYIHT